MISILWKETNWPDPITKKDEELIWCRTFCSGDINFVPNPLATAAGCILQSTNGLQSRKEWDRPRNIPGNRGDNHWLVNVTLVSLLNDAVNWRQTNVSILGKHIGWKALLTKTEGQTIRYDAYHWTIRTTTTWKRVISGHPLRAPCAWAYIDNYLQLDGSSINEPKKRAIWLTLRDQIICSNPPMLPKPVTT